MYSKKLLLIIGIVILIAYPVTAQMGSELSGRIVHNEQPLPGVRVVLSSPALQGQMATVSNDQGDYIFKGLPAGDYKVHFELASFTTLEYDVKMSTSQPRVLDAIMYLETMAEEVIVTGQYETVSTGAQGSETMEQRTLEKLPVLRTLNSAVALSAGTANTAPRGYTSISGGMAYENLYTMNGVVLNENIRGNPYAMYIEDAVLETTTITSNASAEFGRFSGGVVNMVTKSGGNEFSGSFRANATNESWNGETPLTTAQDDTTNWVYEATFGGYIMRDRLWFFLAGRDREASGTGQIQTPGQPEAGIPYPTSSSQTRLEGKLTAALTNSHRVTLSYIDIDTKTGYWPFFTPADWEALDDDRLDPNVGWSASYTGVLSDNFFLEGLYSEREYTFKDSGGDDPSLGGGTPVLDLLNFHQFNAPIFCGICDDEIRANENFYGKASWFLSGAGTHDLAFGFDVYNDIRSANNYQSASGYIYFSFIPQDYTEPGNPYLNIDYFGGYIVWGDVLEETAGNSLKTKSAYVNDTWRVSDKLTLGLGLRYDKNDAVDAGGAKTADDYRISPRISASWDVKGDGRLILTAGANQYVMALAQSMADAGSSAGQPTWAYFIYAGPEIRAGTAEYPTNPDALDAMFDWFFNVYGGPTNTALATVYDIPGLTPKVAGGLKSPYANEFTIGASWRLGTRGVLRGDYVYRKFGDFYAQDISPNRWIQVPNTDTFLDQGLIVNNDSLLEREYNALMVRFDYRIGSRWSLGGNYTYSKSEGNWEGETFGSGPVSSSVLSYMEYKDPEWNTPVGLLDIDQKHKARLWVVWDMIASTHHNLSFSLLQSFFSGTPYSAAADINTIQYVGSPSSLGYQKSPGNVAYYFSDRGAFRTENVTRTDLALNYSFFVNIGGNQLEFFLQPEVVNVFNESAVIDPNTTVLTAINSTSLQPFNPWTEEPVEGVHWRKGSNWGEPQGEGDFQQARTIRFSVGLRF